MDAEDVVVALDKHIALVRIGSDRNVSTSGILFILSFLDSLLMVNAYL